MSANSGEPGPTTKGGEPTAEIPQTRESTAEIPETREPATEHLSDDERAELERLRAENAELHDDGAARPSRRRFSWRALFATILIVLGCVLAPISVVGVWAGNQITDTGRYVATVQPLIDDPAIQNVLTDKITNEITSQLNLTGLINQATAQLQTRGLPRISTLLTTFGPQITSAVTGFIHSTVHTVISSQAMATAWVQVNTVAHQAVVKAAVRAGRRHAYLDQRPDHAQPGPAHRRGQAGPAGARIRAGLHIPIVNATVPLFQAKDLGKAQAGYRLVSDLKIVLPILALVLLAAGVFTARGRRRALIVVGLGVAASMVVLAIGLLIARTIYLNSVPASVLPTDAAAAAFDALVHFLREGLRVVLAVGLVIAIGAFITGPSRAAVRTRAGLGSGITWLRNVGERRGVSTGPFGQWTYRHRALLRIGALTLVALILVFWGQPTALTVILLVVILLILLGLIELVASPPAEPAAVGQE